jgi:hypothetical protein
MAALCLDAIVKGNHSHVVFRDTPLHVVVLTDSSRLPGHTYLMSP